MMMGATVRARVGLRCDVSLGTDDSTGATDDVRATSVRRVMGDDDDERVCGRVCACGVRAGVTSRCGLVRTVMYDDWARAYGGRACAGWVCDGLRQVTGGRRDRQGRTGLLRVGQVS